MTEAARLDLILSAEAAPMVAGLKKGEVAVQKFGKSAEAVTKKTGSNFTNLGRVLQDLPFGFIGIQNNLTQLVPGVGALGLAISAVTSAITFSQVGLSNWTRGFEKNKEAIEESKNALEDLAGSVAKDLLKARELATLFTDKSNPYNVRLNALKEFRKEYGPFLKDLSDEALLNGQIETAIKAINAALLAKLQLQAGEEAILKILKQRLAVQVQLNNLQNTQLNTAGFAESLKDATGNAKGLGIQLKSSLKDSFKTMAQMQAQIKQFDAQIENLFRALKAPLQASAELDIKPDKIKKVKIPTDFFLVDANIKDISQKFIDKIAVETGNHLGEVQAVLDGKPLQFNIEPPKVSETLDDILKQYSALVGITEQLGAAFGSVFNELLTTGRLSFKAVSQAITQMITKLITAVIEAALLTAILSALRFGGAGFGAIFSKLIGLGNVIGHAEGGIFGQPTMWGGHAIGEKGPEALIPLDRLANMMGGGGNQPIVLDTRISGSDLVLVMNRQQRRNNRNYGSNYNN